MYDLTRREHAFGSTIAAIYDCALAPEQWRDALPLMAGLGAAAATSIVIEDQSDGRSMRVYEHGCDQFYLRSYFERLLGARTPEPADRNLPRLGEPSTVAVLCGEREQRESAFYQRWVRPLGLRDMYLVSVLQSGRRLAWLSLARSEIQPLFSDGDLEQIRALTPHICRAFAIANAFDLQTVRNHMLEQVVDSLSTGVILTSSSGQVSYMNTVAEEIVREGEFLRYRHGRLQAASPAMAAGWSATMYDVQHGHAPMRTGHHTLALTGTSGDAAVASVLPLEWRGAANPIGQLPGAVAVFLQDVTRPRQLPVDALRQLYDLTTAELRVLDLLILGLSPQEMASSLRLKLPTVRTHLKRIYAKTGTAGQTELITLITRLQPSVREFGADSR